MFVTDGLNGSRNSLRGLLTVSSGGVLRCSKALPFWLSFPKGICVLLAVPDSYTICKSALGNEVSDDSSG